MNNINNSYKINNLNNSPNTNIITDNNIIVFLVVIYALLYTIENNKIIDNNIFKLSVFILMVYIASINILVASIIALVMLIIAQWITYNNILNEAEKFDQYNQHDQYLSDPLQKSNNLERLGNNINFKLETPQETYLNMISDGKKMVDESHILYDDAIKNKDDNLKIIANDLYIKGSTLIQNGINMSQDNTPNNSLKNNDLNYIVYENLLNNYSDNKQIMLAFNDLKNDYSNNQNIIYENNSQFEIKLNNLYKKQFKLLIEINNANTNESKNKSKILEQINDIKLIINDIAKNSIIEDKINKLTSLFM